MSNEKHKNAVDALLNTKTGTAVSVLALGGKIIVEVVAIVLGVALLILILGTVVNQLGFLPRGWRALGPEPLAYICGAYWLWRRAS